MFGELRRWVAEVGRCAGVAWPDPEGRVPGTTMDERASTDPADSSLVDRLSMIAFLTGVRLYRPRRGDLLVVRGARLSPESLRVQQALLGEAGVLLIQMPERVRVHVEGRAKPAEDLGYYRETGNLPVDAGTGGDGERGKQVCGSKGTSGGTG